MSGIYYTDMLDLLRAAGVKVGENSITAGWQSRSRSSGGFPSPPLCVFWHHTASQTSVNNDLTYMIQTCPDRPVGNMLLDRTGTVWPIAAGASNCAGMGGPMTFSRGTIPVDSGNTRGWQIEVANNGVGEAWPQAQIDAMFKASNALNARFGNKPTDITSHALGAGDGYTSRKIDPATAAATQGPWHPRSTNSSGTWSLADMRSECSRRASSPPTPIEQPPAQPFPVEDTDMQVLTNPQRIHDSRNGSTPIAPNGVRNVQMHGAAPGAKAVGVTISAVIPVKTGYCVAYGNAKPATATINYRAGESMSGFAIVPVGSDGLIHIFTSAEMDVIVDLSCWW